MAELRMYTNKLDEKEDYIGRLQMQIRDMEDYIGRLQMQIRDTQEEIQKLRFDNAELLKKNDELESENYYFHRRIAILKEENQKLKETLNNPIGYLDLDLVDKAMKYGDFARHIRKKYEALTDAGFSHDDAMSLIPLWDDADFEEFKEGN